MNSENRYQLRGVSSTKEEVHQAISKLDKGLFPNAFCKIVPDYLGQSVHHCLVMHADGAGTKSALAYIYWKETGDISVWKGIAQDAIVMNLDDIMCIGLPPHVLVNSTIGRNKMRIPGEVIQAIIEGTQEFIDSLEPYGIKMHFTGGETADIGDIVKTIVVDSSVTARFHRNQVIVPDIKPGNVIVGLASFGQAIYETNYNSGIGSNGLTSARHDLFKHFYAEKYLETFDELIDNDLVYAGKHFLTDLSPVEGMNIGQLALSPTRTYAPVIVKILNSCKVWEIKAIIHNTGGGQTKAKKFIGNAHIIKDNLFEVPPVFQLIQQSSGTPWSEMYPVFNMGHRMEIYTTEVVAPKIITIAESFGIEAKIIGHVEESQSPKLTISSSYGTFEY